MVMVLSELQIVVALMMLLTLAAGAWLTVRKYRRQWVLVSIKGDFTKEHHLPEDIPVPRREVPRVKEGDFSLDEAVGWIETFVRTHRRSKLRPEFQCVLRKYDVYKQLADKMGRGLWRDVFALGQRLAELDPLDPSASIARGRAMREMGNFPGAIRFYQQALELTPFHSTAFPEMAATCRVIGQPGRFRAALDKARQELGDTHPLTIEGRIQLGELVRIYADPTDPATVAHIPREQYLHTIEANLSEMAMDPTTGLQIGQSMLVDEDMPEIADEIVERCRRDFGESAEILLLQGMIEHYRLNHAAAEKAVRASLRMEDSGAARLELGKILLERSLQVEQDSERQKLDSSGRAELRLAVDRDPDLTEAVALLVEKGWDRGLEGVIEQLQPLMKVYPHASSVWRVLGDAYLAERQYDKAIEAYQSGLKHQTTDALLLACLNAMEQTNRRSEMLALARSIDGIHQREPQLRFKVAQTLCEHQRLGEARRVLQTIADDEQVVAQLRQRANNILDELDNIERQQFAHQKGTAKRGK